MRRIRPPLAENFAAAEGILPTMVWSCGAQGQAVEQRAGEALIT
jgi:hypothetical protein